MFVENKSNTIYIYGRNPDTSRYTLKEEFENYLYYEHPEGEHTSIFGDKVRKHFYREQGRKESIEAMKENDYNLFEADVPIRIRYYIEKYKNEVWLPEEPLRVCMLDIEVDDSDGYPNMTTYDKPILSICCHDNFKDKMHVFYVAPDGSHGLIKTDKANYYKMEDEESLLLKFVDFNKKMDFDLIFAWNGDGFDFPYIFNRMKQWDIEPEKLSPLRKCEYVSGKPIGRYWIDLMAAFKKVATSQFESYSLDYIGRSFVGHGKIEHSGKVGDLWRSDLPTFLQYNINDVQLMVEIERKRGIIKYFDTIRRLTFCSFYDIFFNSRVLDCYFLKEALKRNIILPNKPKSEETTPIQGARVIPPVAGLHWYVACGDVRSLYPTAFLTCNMSPETISKSGDITVGPTSFLSHPRGFIPQVIQQIWDLRQSWKSEMKKYQKGSAEYEMWDNLQTCAKFLLNSIYGVMLMPGFRLYDKRIGSAITEFGRETNIWMEQKIVEQGYEVLAGDSVTGEMKVSGKPIKDYFTQVDYVSPDGKEYCFNTFKTDTIDKNGKTILGDVKYVMRHKTNKKIYRIHFTNLTYLDVTEDHSVYGYLVNKNGNTYTEVEQMIPIKPTQIGKKVNSLIVQQYVNRQNVITTNYPNELYELIGYFIGNGSFEKAHNGVNVACGKDYDEINSKLILPLIASGYIDYATPHGGRGDVRYYGKLAEIINMARDDNGGKKIPDFIYTDSKEHIALFLKGFFSADGSASIRNNSTILKCTQIHRHIIEQIQYLLLCCGVSSSIYKDNTANSYKGKYSNTYNYVCNVKNVNMYADNVGFIQKRKQDKIIKRKYEKKLYGINKVSKVEIIDYDDYVYDIEVEGTHKFFANGILVHNTDSIIFKVGVDDPIKAKEAIEYVNSTLDKFCEDNFGSSEYNKMYVEDDKMYKSILFIKDENGNAVKKRYAGLIYVSDGKRVDPPYLDVKGFDAKRSDTPQIVRDLQKEVFMKILEGGDKKDVKSYVKAFRNKITNGDFPPESVAIPKGMTKAIHEYDKAMPIHITGAKYANEYCGANIKREKVKYLRVLRVPQNYPMTHVVSFTEKAPEGFIWDMNAMATNLIDKKFKNIFFSMGWDDQVTLDFF